MKCVVKCKGPVIFSFDYILIDLLIHSFDNIHF